MGLLSAAQTTQIFQLFQLPENPNIKIVETFFQRDVILDSTLGPTTYSTGTIQNAISQLNACLEAVTASQLTQIEEQLTRLSEVGFTKPIMVKKDAAGTEGHLADYPMEREDIRRQIANIIGFYAPEGGFYSEAKRAFGRSACRPMNDR